MLAFRNSLRLLTFTTKCVKGGRSFCRQSFVMKDATTGTSAHANMRPMVNPSGFEKRVLVASKYFPSTEEVPDRVYCSTIKQAKDWYRIRVCMYMIGATMVGCVIMIILGKQAAKSGETVSKQGLDRQMYLREQGKREEAERQNAAAQSK